jgi:soluble lytic murein transglycosylase-like protein
MRAGFVIASAAMAAGAYVYYRRSQDEQVTGDVVDSVSNFIEDATGGTVSLRTYSYAAVPVKYRAAIAAAEGKHSLPQNMLARLLWQESRYREDIITGTKTSPVGAAGIAQFMPGTAAEMGINPLDPFASIDAAGRYLARMYGMFKDWSKALAAYNWGPGNVQRKGLARAPAETRSYYTQILADIGMPSNVA